MTKQLAEIQKDAGCLMASALRTTGAGKISVEQTAAIKEYTASNKLLQDTIAEIDQFAQQSAQMSVQINSLMRAGGGAIDHVQLQHLQGVRKSSDTEKAHTEAVLLKHFDSGLGDLGGSRKPDALSIPNDLNAAVQQVGLSPRTFRTRSRHLPRFRLPLATMLRKIWLPGKLSGVSSIITATSLRQDALPRL
jgi:hypothetical protein